MPIEPRIIERDYLDIERQDSSIELRNKMRAYWGRGEHLWDVDVRNNFQFANWWLAPKVIWRRDSRPPWPVSDLNDYVSRVPDYSLIWSSSGSGWSQKPFRGAKAYVQADYTYVGFDGNNWKVMCEVPIWKPRMVLSFYISASGYNDRVKWVVEQAFWVPKNAPFSRSRGLSQKRACTIYKNDEEVGRAFQSDSEGGIRFNEDTTFEVGDIISFDGGFRNLAISILGKRI